MTHRPMKSLLRARKEIALKINNTTNCGSQEGGKVLGDKTTQ